MQGHCCRREGDCGGHRVRGNLFRVCHEEKALCGGEVHGGEERVLCGDEEIASGDDDEALQVSLEAWEEWASEIEARQMVEVEEAWLHRAREEGVLCVRLCHGGEVDHGDGRGGHGDRDGGEHEALVREVVRGHRSRCLKVHGTHALPQRVEEVPYDHVHEDHDHEDHVLFRAEPKGPRTADPRRDQTRLKDLCLRRRGKRLSCFAGWRQSPRNCWLDSCCWCST